MPKLHKKVKTPKGIGKVRDLNILNGRVSVVFDDGERSLSSRRSRPISPLTSQKAPSRTNRAAKRKRNDVRFEAPTPKSDDKKVDSGESAPKKKRRRNRNKAKGQEQTSREQSQDATAAVAKVSKPVEANRPNHGESADRGAANRRRSKQRMTQPTTSRHREA